MTLGMKLGMTSGRIIGLIRDGFVSAGIGY
jgi:hypothetical protein